MVKVRKLPPLGPEEKEAARQGRGNLDDVMIVAEKKRRSSSASRPSTKSLAKRTLPLLICGHIQGLERSTGKELQRGKMHPMRSLDLHGHRLEQARQLLASALQLREDDTRCLLVVTGKGAGNDGIARGKLRAAVPLWVNQSDIRPHLLGFCYAQAKDGGDGAYYLLLRRK